MLFMPGFLKYVTGMFSHSVVSQDWLQKRAMEGVGHSCHPIINVIINIINIQQQSSPLYVCMGKVLNVKPEASAID